MTQHNEIKSDIFARQLRAAYKTGLQDGLVKAHTKLRLMMRTHHRLYEELCRFDNYAPLPDGWEVIHLPDQKVRHLIRRLRRLRESYWVRYLNACRKEQLGKFCQLADKVNDDPKRKEK